MLAPQGSPRIPASDKPVADVSETRAAAAANAAAEHPRERSGEPVQRASRSAAGGGVEARDAGPPMCPRSRSGN